MLSIPMKRALMISAVAGAMMAAPTLAEAQRGNDRRGADRPELIRRGDKAQQAPAFCRSGAGHPVHGRRWCEERGWGNYDRGRYDSRVYDRSTSDRNRRGANDDRSRRGSSNYETAHAEFHRIHDRECRAMAAERPLDLQHQVRVRNECRIRHEEWHRRMGRSH